MKGEAVVGCVTFFFKRFPMTQTEHLWLLCSLWQVALLTCDLRSQPFEVEVTFGPFPSNPEADSYTATCGREGNPLIFSKRIDRSACSPDCRLRLHMSEDHRRCSILLRASRNDSVLEMKTLHFIPASVSSFSVSSTTTTAHLKWEPLHRQQSISALTLYNMHTQSVTGIYNINSPEIQSKFTMKNLQPGTRHMVEVLVATLQTQPGIKLTQKLSIFLETDQCPHGWLANGRSCYTVKRSGLSWGDAMSSCTRLVGGSHLADLKTLEDLLFVSSHLQTDNNPLLLWTGLNDQQEEGHPLWSDGSPYNQTDTVMSLLPASQADCFAFQKNATGPGYFLTPFFCEIPLPFICQYQTPSTPASFSFNLAQVTDQQVELRWSDLSSLRSPHFSSFEIFLQYRESESALPGHDMEDGCKESEGGRVRKSRPSFAKTFRVPISLSSREVTLTGLSPGSIYFFTLQVSQHAGPSWSLGQTQTAYTKPLPPQSITIGPTTASQITVHWMLPDTACASEWEFAVLCVDVSSRQERVVSNVSRVFETNRKWFCTAIVGGLESYTKYRIEVFTITKFGIWSCGPAPLTVRTAVEPPADLVMFSVNGSLSVCWTVPPSDPPDAYYVATQSFNSPAASSLWINDSSSGGLGKDESICANLGAFTPGHTYEVAVVAVRGNDRSERSINIHTTAPMPVQVAVPLSVGTNYTQLYVHPPRVGLIDGVKVCACLAVCNRTCKGWCEYACEWHALPAGIYIATISSLTPGSEYQLSVYSTMKGRVGPPFYTHPIKTSPAPPSRVREGVVTDSSVELLWDPAPGQGQSYEVSCLNCDHGLKVQKVFGQSAVFSGLTPGSLYRFAVRTEKESFTDSSPVSINITAGGTMSIILGLSSTISIIISAAVSIIYTFLGGLYSVAYTDVIQLCFIFISLWLCVPFIVLSPAVTTFSQSLPLNQSHEHSWIGQLELADAGKWVDDMLLLALGGLSYQALYQRILSAASSAQAQVTCFAAAGTVFILGIPSIAIGVMAGSADWNQTAYGLPPPFERGDAGKILPLALQQLTPPWVAVLGIGAVAAAVMSSMDSVLLSSASMFTQNIYKSTLRKKASERELQWVIRISVLLVGLAGMALAFGDDSVAALWFLSGDLLYCVIFPQLVCVLHFQRANTYGAISGFVVGLLLRLLSGEPVLRIPPLLLYPGWREENNQIRQYFPYRTVAMLSSVISIIAVSWLLDLMFNHQLIPESWDFMQVFKKKNETDDDKEPDPYEEMNQVLKTKL